MFSFYAIADITSYPQSGAADIKTSNNLITLVPEAHGTRVSEYNSGLHLYPDHIFDEFRACSNRA